MMQIKLAARLDPRFGRIVIYEVYSGTVLFRSTLSAEQICKPEQIAKMLVDHAEYSIDEATKDVRRMWFPVTYVSRDDMTQSMPEEKAQALTDEQMSEIASGMGEAYVGSGSYWIDADIIGEEETEEETEMEAYLDSLDDLA